MAKHKKHEEHENHERWLVSFADMMTLLFALFVVLYAMGVTDADKATQVQNSMERAFLRGSDGDSMKAGYFDSGAGDGSVLVGPPLVTTQDGPMREFLEETLAAEFRDVAGTSLEVDQIDDRQRFTTPMSAWFEGRETDRLRHGDAMVSWLVRLLSGAMDHTAQVRVVLKAPFAPAITGAGIRGSSLDLCHARAAFLHRILMTVPRIQPEHLEVVVRESDRHGDSGAWADRSVIQFEFSNGR